MHICAVLSHADFLATAGVRIRYLRLKSALALAGSQLTIASIDVVANGQADAAEVFVFSKTYSALAQLLMHRLKAKGKIVGFDLFDDYFSQSHDSRLVFFRDWLARSRDVLDFAICSTKVLQNFLSVQWPGVPSLVLPDAVAHFDVQRIEAMLSAKLARARKGRMLSLLWFGIGDNPYFDVGLSDLASYGTELAQFARRRWEIRLTVLTNDAALTDGALYRLAGLDVPYELETWSEEAEAAALEKADVCFLPVNAQGFSRSKSLNRAVTSLAAGCLVLSPGFPLYGEIEELVHPTVRSLLDILEHGGLPVQIGRLTSIFGEFANAYANASALESFLWDVGRKSSSQAEPGPTAVRARRDVAIIHGIELDILAHKCAKKLLAISVRSPLTEAGVDFDIAFTFDESYALQVAIKPNSLPCLQSRWSRQFEDAPNIGNFHTRKISDLGLPGLPHHIVAAMLSSERVVNATALYAVIVNHLSELCTALLDDFEVCLSDRSRIARMPLSSQARLAS